MASYSMEEFLGDGALKGLFSKLAEGGWVDVPTLKMMDLASMDAMKLSQRQKDALEIRSYLHDRSLMEYADRMEASGESLPKLLTLKTSVLSLKFGMNRGCISRFIERTCACRNSIQHVLSARQRTLSSRTSISQAPEDYELAEGYVYKGIVAAEPDGRRWLSCCGEPPITVDDVASYSSIEKISIRKITTEYMAGMDFSMEMKAQPMKASNLWRDKPVILLCLRRPGCVMCRAEAHQLYARKPIFDAMGFELIAVLHEKIEPEVKALWPRYWGGSVVLDQSKEFYKALGGGKLLKDRFVTGFLFNPRAISNYKRAKATGAENSIIGEGEIKGGLFIIGPGKSGIAYQFIERNFGDRAPISEVIQICSQMQSKLLGQAK
ncbi:uncharacterized protein M6B38_409005 [Iris pallida]|uniref:Peroxiredoxin-like 2A n=1 Tax=Iris pallida TaxID=29817 RepID=A0AAX6FMX7_IRIPA|nr:uncharacterized protein M6B38_409005 [Iris pallida]